MEGCGLASGLSYALLGGGVVTFELDGSSPNTLLDRQQCTLNLGSWGGLKRVGKLGHALHIFTGRFGDPHSRIRKTGTYWDKGHIGKRISVLHRQLRDVQGLKTTRGGALGQAFFPFTFFCGMGGGLGKAFSPFSFCCGTRAVWGGYKEVHLRIR